MGQQNSLKELANDLVYVESELNRTKKNHILAPRVAAARKIIEELSKPQSLLDMVGIICKCHAIAQERRK